MTRIKCAIYTINNFIIILIINYKRHSQCTFQPFSLRAGSPHSPLAALHEARVVRGLRSAAVPLMQHDRNATQDNEHPAPGGWVGGWVGGKPLHTAGGWMQ